MQTASDTACEAVQQQRKRNEKTEMHKMNRLNIFLSRGRNNENVSF